MLVIHPDECIDCALCEPECPIDAIYAEEDLPEKYAEYLDINQRLSQQWPVLTEKIDAPEDADKWVEVADKRHLLDESTS